MKNTISIFSAILILISTSCFSQSIKKVKIGTQIWMAENLNVDHFQNGDVIPEARTAEEWQAAGENHQPAWCYYENRSVQNDPDNGEKYGKLYNWYAVNDPRGLAPKGWHVPTDDEWTKLSNFLGGENWAATSIRNKSGWKGSYRSTNSSGFSGLPGGFRSEDGSFRGISEFVGWWASSDDSTDGAWRRTLDYFSGLVLRIGTLKAYGLSVRCIKD